MPRHFCVAGVALGDMDLRLAWQAWRLATSIFVLRGKPGTPDAWLDHVSRLGPLGRPGRRFVLRGRRGASDTGLGRVARLGPLGRTPRHSCVAGVALGDMGLRFAWQAWHLAASSFVLRGRCANSDTGLGRVARLGPLGRPARTFAWQAWRLATGACDLHGMRGAWQHRSSFCVAGVALLTLGWVLWRA